MYDYRRKVADGSWFSNFTPVKKDAMLGNTAELPRASIQTVGGHYLFRVEARGTTHGTDQHVTDTIRFIASDIRELADKFFYLGLVRWAPRVSNKTGAKIKIDGTGMVVYAEVEFHMPPGDHQAAFSQAARAVSVELV
jgi:hypothetical protein